MLSLLSCVLLSQLTSPDAGRPAGGADGGMPAPAEWVLSLRFAPDSGVRDAFFRELAAPVHHQADGGTGGEAVVTRARAEALFADPRAQLVYGEKTVAIVSPSHSGKHHQEHLDLMKLFLAPERLEAGAAFVKAHDDELTKTETKWQVPREVIVAILMWESKLGTITGEYVAFNVFTSQAFFIDDASRVAMAKKEERALADDAAQAARVETIRTRARKNLVALLRQCESRGLDPLSVKGSWAGALGFPQFMPASLRWADDGDADGRIDLFGFPDAIASIGRYLNEHGFQASRTQAVYGYNHEDAYVKGVLAYADALHAKLTVDAGTPPTKK